MDFIKDFVNISLQKVRIVSVAVGIMKEKSIILAKISQSISQNKIDKVQPKIGLIFFDIIE